MHLVFIIIILYIRKKQTGCKISRNAVFLICLLVKCVFQNMKKGPLPYVFPSSHLHSLIRVSANLTYKMYNLASV